MTELPDTALMQSFVVVAQELNFRRGAERLAIDQSALSRRIQRLEAVLGYALLERTTRDVVLTPAGHSYYGSVATLLDDSARAVAEARRVAEGRTGRVRVAFMAFAATELMPRAVARFQADYPDIELQLRYIRSQGQKVALANDEVDVCYMIGPYDNSDCQSDLLACDPLYLVAPRGHPLLAASQVAPADLVGQDLILGDTSEWGEFRHRLDDMFNTLGIALRPRLEASNTLALIGLVAAGLGVTIYPESLIGVLGKAVDVRPIDHPDFRVRTVLVRKRNNRARAVLNFVRIAQARGRPAGLPG